MQYFTSGPYDTFSRDGDLHIGSTTITRLLRFGARPIGSNDANCDRIIQAVENLPGREAWFGMRPLDVVKLKGWLPGLAIAEKYRQMLPELHPHAIGRRPRWAADGDEFDQDRFDAGIEECWKTRRRVQIQARPILKLTCALGANSRIEASQICWMGAAAFALVDAAESAGYRIEIEGIWQTRNMFRNGDGFACVVRIKGADEPLDRESAVMAMACPAFYRWHMIHSAAAFSPDLTVTAWFGSTVAVSESLRGDLHMPHAYSEEAAAEALMRLVEQLDAIGTPA